MAPVSVRRLRKRFGEVEAINGLDMDVNDGELLVLVGPSGCGKTTLLRVIAGLEKATEGDVVIAGRVVNELPPKDRDIAMVFQNYALYPHMTVRENVLFGLKARGGDRDLMAGRLKEVAVMLDLAPLLDRYPRQLSGGQRQRVAMGRAIARHPQVFLFDEPLSNIDANLRVRMRTDIKSLQQQLRTTAIYVTHDQAEAMTIADRIVVMNHGQIEQIGSPLSIYDHPANQFVAGFIGAPSMNFLQGRIRRRNGLGFFEAADGTMLPLPTNAAGEDGCAVTYGFRPENVDISTTDGLPSAVGVVEPTGAITYVFSKGAGVSICSAFAERITFRPGEEIRLLPRLASVRLFDSESGIALS